MIKFKTEIEIHPEHFQILLDYVNGYILDSEYFEFNGYQSAEEEMLYNIGYLSSGFYQHYPLFPTPLGDFIINCYNNKLK